jgi:hypothetical protein
MPRRSHDYQLKRQISTRLQRIIEERYESLYAFTQVMKSQGRGALASTVRGWLPPQRAWKLKPDGAGVRRIDWKAVRIPDGSTLIEFCNLLSVRADFILLGDGDASRTQSRSSAALESDVAAHIADALQADGFKYWQPQQVYGGRVLAEAIKAAKDEASNWKRVVETAPARLAASSGLLLDEIGRLGPHMTQSEDARMQFLMASQVGAMIEHYIDSDPRSLLDTKTRYLAAPKLDADGLPYPAKAIEQRMLAAAERVDDQADREWSAEMKATVAAARKRSRKRSQS